MFKSFLDTFFVSPSAKDPNMTTSVIEQEFETLFTRAHQEPQRETEVTKDIITEPVREEPKVVENDTHITKDLTEPVVEKKPEPKVEASVVEEPRVEEEPEPEPEEPSYFTESEEPERPQLAPLKKYILKPSEYSKKNIMIVHSDVEELATTTGDLLNGISNMKNIERFNKDIYFFVPTVNRTLFKRILLHNPDLYFENFSVKSSIRNVPSVDKPTIMVVDTALGLSLDKYRKILSSGNVLLIVISTDYNSDLIDIYHALNKSRASMFVHKLETHEQLERAFFERVLSGISPDLEGIQFEDYNESIRNEKYGARYVILRKTELRFN